MAASEGLDRRQLGRTAFVERVWEWRSEQGATILQQLEQLGASLDWDRTQFTLSPQFSAAVAEAFITLYDKGKKTAAGLLGVCVIYKKNLHRNISSGFFRPPLLTFLLVSKMCCVSRQDSLLHFCVRILPQFGF